LARQVVPAGIALAGPVPTPWPPTSGR